MKDTYKQQADALAMLMARGKTLRQASAIVARRWRKRERISPRPATRSAQGEMRRAA